MLSDCRCPPRPSSANLLSTGKRRRRRFSSQDKKQRHCQRNPDLKSAQQALDKAHAGLNAARSEYIPDVSLYLQHIYQNGAPLLPESSATVGIRADWTITEFGKRFGLVRERKAQVSLAQENLHATENKVRMDVESEMRKVHRSDTGLTAARDSVTARTELVRITGDQVVAKTANESATQERSGTARRFQGAALRR